MTVASPQNLKPRKTPRQARAEATVDAILEATIQVLLSEGAGRLTTTRVAARAGVSVGTMYQYFPHKAALLYAVLKQHLDTIAEAVEAACARLRGEAIATIGEGLVLAYLDAKTDADIREYMSGNLCRCAAYPNIVAAIKQAREQMELP